MATNKYIIVSISLKNLTQRIKFVINVPMEVRLPTKTHPKEDIMSQCQRLLTLLEETGFSEKDQEHLQDVAIVIGLNGKESPDRRKLLEQLKESKEITHLRFAKVSYTWGPGGDIYNKESPPVPYQDIREYLKDHSETKKLVKELRGTDECLVYFSFIDADTQDFNQVYSSYLKIVQMYSDKCGSPPTVMSTGYEFPEGKSEQQAKFQAASRADNYMRIETAKQFPLGTYYPEPNFCVLLPDGDDTILESFRSKDPKQRKDKKQNMESPTLVRQVKKRDNFIPIFAEGNPIITAVPARAKLNKHGATIQSHCNVYIWATSALAHGEVEYNRGQRGDFGRARGFLMRILGCSNEEFEGKFQEEFPFEGPNADKLANAVRAARLYNQKAVEATAKQSEM